MTRTLAAPLATGALLLSACAPVPPSRPTGWNAPEVVNAICCVRPMP